MKRNLIISVILCCISMMTVHSSDIDVKSEQICPVFSQSEFRIGEYTHEQSASRPSDISVPSIARTPAGRCNQNSGGNSLSNKCENQTHSNITESRYSHFNRLSCGHTDSGSLFISLCNLLI